RWATAGFLVLSAGAVGMNCWMTSIGISSGWIRRSCSEEISDEGVTLDDATAQLSGELEGGAMPNWFDTHTPLIVSAGWLAYHPIAWQRLPAWLRIFQIALHCRLVLETGRRPAPSGVGSTNPRMPCCGARFPVAMLVQRIGESIGWSVRIFPETPPSTIRWRLGMRPASISGWIICQSAA